MVVAVALKNTIVIREFLNVYEWFVSADNTMLHIKNKDTHFIIPVREILEIIAHENETTNQQEH